SGILWIDVLDFLAGRCEVFRYRDQQWRAIVEWDELLNGSRTKRFYADDLASMIVFDRAGHNFSRSSGCLVDEHGDGSFRQDVLRIGVECFLRKLLSLKNSDGTGVHEQVSQLHGFLVITARGVPQIENNVCRAPLQKSIELSLRFCSLARSKIWNLDVCDVVLQHLRVNRWRLSNLTRNVHGFRIGAATLDD